MLLFNFFLGLSMFLYFVFAKIELWAALVWYFIFTTVYCFAEEIGWILVRYFKVIFYLKTIYSLIILAIFVVY